MALRICGGPSSKSSSLPRPAVTCCTMPMPRPHPLRVMPGVPVRRIPGVCCGGRRLQQGLQRASDVNCGGTGQPADDASAGGYGWSPELGEVDLDDEYFKFEDDKTGLDADPEAVTLSMKEMQAFFDNPELLDLAERAPGGGISYGPKEAGSEAEEDLPEVVLLAGLRAEELPMVRVLMDKLGWTETRVVPVTNAMLYEPLGLALDMPEPNWEEPRNDGWQGGGLGAERILLFSGLRTGMQATLVELLEQSGLPAVSIAAVDWSTDQTTRRLGDVLAKAIQEQRSVRKLASRSLWKDASPDVYGELGSVEEAVKRATEAQQEAEPEPESEPEAEAEHDPEPEPEPAPEPESAPEGLGKSSDPTSAPSELGDDPGPAPQSPSVAGAIEESEAGHNGTSGELTVEPKPQPGPNLIDELLKELDFDDSAVVSEEDLDYAALRYKQGTASRAEEPSEAADYSPGTNLEAIQEALEAARADGITRDHVKDALTRLAAGQAPAPGPVVHQESNATQDEVAKPIMQAGVSAPAAPTSSERRPPNTGQSELEVRQHSALKALLKEAAGSGITSKDLKTAVYRLNQSLSSKDTAGAVLSSLDPDSEDVRRQEEEDMRSQGFVTSDEFKQIMRRYTSQEERDGSVRRGTPEGGNGSRVLTIAELSNIAEKYDLDLDQLLQDAESRGIVIEE